MSAVYERAARGCVFLDRDGTLVEDHGYVHRPDDLRILSGVPEGLSALRQAGLWLVVVTNQSGVARGYFSEAQVATFHAHLSAQLGPDAAPDAYYACPFHPEAVAARYRRDSQLRKPRIGMFELARRHFAIDVTRSFMVGDRWLDVEFAHNACLRAILVGDSSEVHNVPPPNLQNAAYVRRPDFSSATQTILTALAREGADKLTSSVSPAD